MAGDSAIFHLPPPILEGLSVLLLNLASQNTSFDVLGVSRVAPIRTNETQKGPLQFPHSMTAGEAVKLPGISAIISPQTLHPHAWPSSGSPWKKTAQPT